MFSELGPVSVPPHSGKPLEIRGAVLEPAWIVPKRHRHTGKRFRTHELPRCSAQRRARRSDDVHRHAESAGLQLAAPDGAGGVADGEAGDDLRPPADVAQVYVPLDGVVDVVVAVAREWTAGGHNGPEGGQVVRAPWRQSFLLRQSEVLGARAEDGHAFLGRHRPEHLGVRGEGRAVVQHHRGADGQGADQPVPHHPAAGGEVEEPVLPCEVHVQHVLLQVLQQSAAGAVDHTLGEARRA